MLCFSVWPLCLEQPGVHAYTHTQSSHSNSKAKCLEPAHPPDKTEDTLFHSAQVGTPGNFTALQEIGRTDPVSPADSASCCFEESLSQRQEVVPSPRLASLACSPLDFCYSNCQDTSAGSFPTSSRCPSWSLGRKGIYLPRYALIL